MRLSRALCVRSDRQFATMKCGPPCEPEVPVLLLMTLTLPRTATTKPVRSGRHCRGSRIGVRFVGPQNPTRLQLYLETRSSVVRARGWLSVLIVRAGSTAARDGAPRAH